MVVALLLILSSTTTYSYPTEFVAQQLPAYALLAEDDNLEPFLENQETIELKVNQIPYPDGLI